MIAYTTLACAAVLDLTIYFCRPNVSSLSSKRPISCRPNGHLGKNLSPEHLSPKRLVAQMTVHRGGNEMWSLVTCHW